jgi:hypothetical protein
VTRIAVPLRDLLRRSVALCLLPLLLCGAGCYAYLPVPSPVPTGTRVAVDLNDQGRADMRGMIGPTIARLEGPLVHNSDTAFVLAVLVTRGMSGQLNRWSGETVSVRREYVQQITERRFSRSRTTIAALVTAGGVLAFILTRDLLGFGGGDVSNVPPGGGGDDQ